MVLLQLLLLVEALVLLLVLFEEFNLIFIGELCHFESFKFSFSIQDDL